VVKAAVTLIRFNNRLCLKPQQPHSAALAELNGALQKRYIGLRQFLRILNCSGKPLTVELAEIERIGIPLRMVFGKIRHHILDILEIFQQSLRQLSYVKIVEILGGRFGHGQPILGAFSRHVMLTSVLQTRLINRFLTSPAR